MQVRRRDRTSARPRLLLALDLGTTTGWAMALPDGGIVSGTVSFRPSRYDGGGMRYVRFRAWLDGIAEDTPGIAAVHFEEVRRHLSTDAAHVHGGLARDADRLVRGASRSPTRASGRHDQAVTSPARATPTRPP